MEKLQITPLGGLGEVGKNMLALEYGRNLLIIDAGIMFPENDMPGVDYIIPDYRYLKGKEDRLRGIIITHGHEDHIGALPHFLQEFNAPVYATKLTRGLIEVKLSQELRKQVKLQEMEPGDVLRLGPFTIEPYHVCHSIPDAVGLGIDTPVGLIVHSGDFKLDHTPVDEWPTDIAKLAEFNRRGVLALLSDSTNSEYPGTTPSEATLTHALSDVFREAQGRIIVATFASLISRIQQVLEVAQKFNRKVAIAGTSMIKNVRMARELGYLDAPDDLIIPLQDIGRLPPSQVTIMATGSQGEPGSIMGRLATNRHASLRIVPGDTVVLSSHTIPGNEETVHRVINRLFQQDARVVYSPIAPVHVSGHASQEEQKTLLNIVRPRFFVPIHGELRHLKQHARLAQQVGIPEKNIAVIENGYTLRFSQEEMTIGERVPGGYIFVDGAWVGDAVSADVIRDRETLAASGVCNVAFKYNPQNGALLGQPKVGAIGIASEEALEALPETFAGLIQTALKSMHGKITPEDVEAVVQRVISDYFYDAGRNRPQMMIAAMPG